jgi:hypothetical protein
VALPIFRGSFVPSPQASAPARTFVARIGRCAMRMHYQCVGFLNGKMAVPCLSTHFQGPMFSHRLN